MCGATNLGEALRRIGEGACLIRSKGEAGTGNIVEAVRHLRTIIAQIRRLPAADAAELLRVGEGPPGAAARSSRRSPSTGTLPVPLFCAGGIATPADASLVRQLGAEAVFVGSGIFKSDDPERMATAIVEATTHFDDAARRRQGLDRARRGDARRARPPPSSSASPSAAGSASRVGVLALQGDVREHVALLGRRSASTRSRVRTAERLDGLDALVHARRGVDDDRPPARDLGAREPLGAAARRRTRRSGPARGWSCSRGP